MLPEGNIRAIANTDLSVLAKLGLDQATAMRAMAQDMGWILADGSILLGAATSYLADGTVFLDRLVGDQSAKLALIQHAVSYARWSYAPAVTLIAPPALGAIKALGFVGIDQERLTPQLKFAAKTNKVLMKRL
ncbi:MAG: hypothetical protein AB8B88_01915 [Devosiaceae bacterium]